MTTNTTTGASFAEMIVANATYPTPMKDLPETKLMKDVVLLVGDLKLTNKVGECDFFNDFEGLLIYLMIHNTIVIDCGMSRHLLPNWFKPNFKSVEGRMVDLSNVHGCTIINNEYEIQNQ